MSLCRWLHTAHNWGGGRIAWLIALSIPRFYHWPCKDYYGPRPVILLLMILMKSRKQCNIIASFLLEQMVPTEYHVILLNSKVSYSSSLTRASAPSCRGWSCSQTFQHEKDETDTCQGHRKKATNTQISLMFYFNLILFLNILSFREKKGRGPLQFLMSQ